jgi:hypothetical protein
LFLASAQGKSAVLSLLGELLPGTWPVHGRLGEPVVFGLGARANCWFPARAPGRIAGFRRDADLGSPWTMRANRRLLARAPGRTPVFGAAPAVLSLPGELVPGTWPVHGLLGEPVVCWPRPQGELLGFPVLAPGRLRLYVDHAGEPPSSSPDAGANPCFCPATALG